LAWPPVMDDPWSSDSLHVFWSKRWHQLLRQTFMVYGGVPGKWLAGDFGMIFGAFLASGLYHELSVYAMGRGFDHRVTLFFLSQAFLLIGERYWRRLTGYRVGGWIGRYWVYTVIFFLGQPVSDAWHLRGLGGGLVIPPWISPFRILALPFLRRLLH